MDFSGGSAGFVQMNLKAGIVKNVLMRKDLRADMSCQSLGFRIHLENKPQSSLKEWIWRLILALLRF
ncbi:MAG: hypothetical protein RLZZ628_2956 [Bacteroidota bacterium]